MVRAKRFWAWLKGERAKPLRDIGSIVLGVLIALGIGEIADDIRWHYKVRDTEAAMRAELGVTRRYLNERMAAGECIERRLTEIGAILRDAQRGKPVPEIANFAFPPYRLLENTAFEVAREEGVSLHMRSERWRMYAAAYGMAYGFYGKFADPERGRWDMLRLLETSRTLDPQLTATLLVAWAEASAYARRQQALAAQGDHILESLGIPIDWTFDTSEGDPRSIEAMKARFAKGKLCQPLVAQP
jgi:hypothetical protein